MTDSFVSTLHEFYAITPTTQHDSSAIENAGRLA